MPVEAIQRLHLVRRQPEAEDVEILRLTDRIGRLRRRHIAVLDMPAQDDLAGRAAKLPGDRDNGRVRQDGPGAADGAPAFGDDAPRPMDGVEIVAAMIGVEMDLVDLRDQALVEQPLEMRRLEIGDADRADEPGLLDFDKTLESLDITILNSDSGQWTRNRSM